MRRLKLDNNRWVTATDVDLGDELLREHAGSIKNKIHPKIPKGASLTGEFLYVVCSPTFRQNPTPEYAPWIGRAYVQDTFDKQDALEHLQSLVDGIG